MTNEAQLLDRLRNTLEICAREGRTITYAELAEMSGFPPPHRIHRMTAMLETLMREDHAAGRPLLASLAISRTGPLPQRGYFDMLRELARYAGPDSGPEAALAHSQELAAVLAAARSDQPPSKSAT